MTITTGRLPSLDANGRFPDRFAPPSVATDAARAETARSQTEATVTQLGSVSGTVSLAAYAQGPASLHLTLTGATTLTIPNGATGRDYSLKLTIKQDTTGGRVLVIKGAGASWAAAIAHTGTANAKDVVWLAWDGVMWTALSGAQAIGIPTEWAV